MAVQIAVTRRTYAGVFMVTLATLMYETLLTRIFSVTMWYHFAFAAISIAMFGMTVGAIVVYLSPQRFTRGRLHYHLAVSALLFAISIVTSFLLHSIVPFQPTLSPSGISSLALIYLIITVPFVFSGLCVSLALTTLTKQLGKLYAADLAGAALGCLVLIYVLQIADAPTVVILTAVIAGVAAASFAIGPELRGVRQAALVCALLLACLTVANSVLATRQQSLFRLTWVKGAQEPPSLYEKWNSFSRVRVFGNPDALESPLGWGLSATYPSDRQVRQLHMDIDASAATTMARFDGNFDEVDYLKYDITNMVHYVRQNAKVLVVGSGGGRDILSALTFQQAAVQGVEINGEIIDAVTGPFGEFTGHLDRIPKVTFVNDEARSYITRSRDRFDIIQVSLIDTWAATAAGAFALTENSLYTVEAWKTFLNHLTPQGILSFSRWYGEESPAEMYRLTALAAVALKHAGIANPRDHLVIVGNARTDHGVATLLVARQPFSDQDIDTLEATSAQLQFEVVLSPRLSRTPSFAAIAAGIEPEKAMPNFPFNVAAPTDDSPFFFHMLRLQDLLNPALWSQAGNLNLPAVAVLSGLLIVVTVLVVLCIIVPLILTTDKQAIGGGGALTIFFLAIGLGFMMVEISQVQRLVVFLGHPVYGLSVALFSMLLSSGLGSLSTERLGKADVVRPGIVRIIGLLLVLSLFGLLTPRISEAFQGSATIVRIAITVAILFPAGFLMGMAFPIGMRVAAEKRPAMTPWLWGINGAASVLASVLAAAIALSVSISAAFWTGWACYLVALGAFALANRRAGYGPSPVTQALRATND